MCPDCDRRRHDLRPWAAAALALVLLYAIMAFLLFPGFGSTESNSAHTGSYYAQDQPARWCGWDSTGQWDCVVPPEDD